MNLAARKTAQPGLADRVLAYLDAGAQAEPDQARWKVLQYQLLVALDRPKELAAKLQAWIAAGDPDNGWRLTLGYLQAETGRLAEAIKLFEAVRAADEARGPDYLALADWYMAVNRRDAYDRARIDAFKAVDDNRLYQWIYAKFQPWQRYDQDVAGTQQPPPRELDAEVLLAFTALLEKVQPAGRLPRINSLSSTSAMRDFRLLAVLADAVVGHTAGQVYPLLQSMSGVLGEIRDEAAADSLVERIAAVRRRAKTPIDQRALDLLEMLVERRAAEIQNQPGPHVGRALAALRRAWKRQWSPGRTAAHGRPARLVGPNLAAQAGRGANRPIAIAHQQSSPAAAGGNADDRLQIGCDLAGAYWNYSRCDQAIDLLSASLDEHQAACGGVLPAAANGALGTLIGYLEARTQHARGERILQEQLKHPANRQQSYWLIERLYELYDSAIQRGGEVSLGSGLDLYRAVQKKVQQDLDTPDQNHRFALAGQLCNIYRSAHNRFPAGYQGRGAEEVAADARRFAFERLPAVLPRPTNNYTSIVSEAANMLHDVAGPRDGLAFLIRRIDGEPHWLRLNNQDGWSQHSSALAEWRAEVFGVGDLDAPLLAIVSGELRRDLHSRQQRNRTMYNRHEQYFWADKEADFARIADEVLGRRQILRRRLPLHRRVPAPLPGPLRSGDRHPAGRPPPRGPGRAGTITPRPVPPSAAPLCRVDPDPRTAGGPPAR